MVIQPADYRNPGPLLASPQQSRLSSDGMTFRIEVQDIAVGADAESRSGGFEQPWSRPDVEQDCPCEAAGRHNAARSPSRR